MDKIKIIKISAFSAVCALQAYLLYLIIGCFAVWLTQPRFASVVGNITTCSWGFLIQVFVCLAVFLIIGAGLVVMGIFFFKKKKKSDKIS